MKFGLRDDHWEIVDRLAIQPLKQRNAKVYLFGSRARGDHDPFSDVDLLVEIKGGVPLDLLAEISAALEDSQLPVKVDLVDASGVAQSFLAEILKQRTEL